MQELALTLEHIRSHGLSDTQLRMIIDALFASTIRTHQSIANALQDVDSGNYDSCSSVLCNAEARNELLHLTLNNIIK